jgi:starch-binding outer membrane protein, SusD/RagB family
MKSIINISGLALVMVILTSCNEEFLNFEPEGRLPEAEFFVTEAHAEQAVNAIYAHMRTWDQVAFPFIAVQELPSDNAIKGSAVGDAAFLNDYVFFNVAPNEGALNGYWSARFKGVNLSNQVLDKIENTSTGEEKKARLIAEAKFLRAYYYFDLVRAFGDIPLVNDLDQAVLQASVRAPKEEVYTQIVNDLTEAIQVLPVTYDAANRGRATKGAAQTLLAKVSLYLEDWDSAASLTDEVIASGAYQLMDDFWGMFRVANENSIESVLEIQAPYDPGDWNLTNTQHAEPQGPRGDYGWGFNAPTDDLASAFDAAGDTIRKNATIIYFGNTAPNGDLIVGIGLNEMEGVNVPRYNGKVYSTLQEREELGWWSSWGQNIRVLRYAEVLLINAEAKVRKGDTAGAADPLNQVRQRAGLQPISNPSIEDVLNERRLELAMEGDRFFDMVRTGIAATKLSANGFVPGKNEVFPIPQNIIDMTDGTISQNPGY